MQDLNVVCTKPITSLYGTPGIEAQVKHGTDTYFFTKLAGEESWHLDCKFCNGLPSFNHGQGARAGLRKQIAQGDLHRLLEDHGRLVMRHRTIKAPVQLSLW